MTEQPPASQTKCLPTYIVIDTSGSMARSEAVLNETLDHLYNELILSPRISEFAQVSIITFNQEAHVVLPMTDLQDVTALPQLKCSGVTNFTSAFESLRSCIDRDVPALRSAGRAVLRPVAFVLTDGQPTDEGGRSTELWRVAHGALVDEAWPRHPHVVTFGFGNAPAEVLGAMATKRGAAFLASNREQEKDALRGIFATLLKTLVASARTEELRLPAEVDGFIRVSQEFIG